MPIPVRLPELEHWKAQVKCQTGCPVATDAGRYVQLIAERRDEDAYLVARAPNPFASVCGRVCAAPCEDACRRGSIDAPISIRALKRFVCEQYGVESTRPDTQDRLRTDLVREGNVYPGHLPITSGMPATGAPTGISGAVLGRVTPAREVPAAAARRVAVVGAGPAGLSAAHDLALLGYRVTVFESSSEPGGMMRFGIPEYRLPRTLIHAEVDKILALGVRLELGTPLTPQFGLAELRSNGFDAVFLAVGVSAGRDLPIPGGELDGVVKAVDYLLNINRGYRMDLGRRVVVIGGGFVAFDAARTAWRLQREQDVDALQRLQDESSARTIEALDSARAALRGGSTEVTIVSLETFDEMPVLRTAQGHEEFEEARKEGIVFLPRRGPKEFVGDTRLRAIQLRKVLSVFDANGRFAPHYDDADVISLDADACVLAIGQRAELSFLKPADRIELTPGGTITIDSLTLATSAPGIFAGGDVAFGPRNLIDAIANGKRAARSIHEYLSSDRASTEVRLDIEEIPATRYTMIDDYEVFDRVTPPTLDLDRRTGISEVETGYAADEARRQAARCLICHTQTIYDPEKCVLCNRCVDICPEYCLAIVPFDDLALDDATRAALVSRAESDGLPLSAMVKDDEKCIRCGLCAVRCPTDAMTMERFAITERFVPQGT